MSVILNALKVKKKIELVAPLQSPLPQEGFFASELKKAINWRRWLVRTGFILCALGGLFLVSRSFYSSESVTEPVTTSLATNLKPEIDQVSLKNNEGLLLLKQGLHQEAEQKFMEAWILNPLCAVCANNLGLLKTKLGLDGEAEQWLKKSLELDPQLAAAQFNLGVLEEKRDNWTEAIVAYQAFVDSPAYSNDPLADRVRRHLAELTKQ